MPNSGLESTLEQVRNSWNEPVIKSVTLIGDSLARASIADAVYSVHRYARKFDEEIDLDEVPFERKLTAITPEPDWK